MKGYTPSQLRQFHFEAKKANKQRNTQRKDAKRLGIKPESMPCVVRTRRWLFVSFLGLMVVLFVGSLKLTNPLMDEKNELRKLYRSFLKGHNKNVHELRGKLDDLDLFEANQNKLLKTIMRSSWGHNFIKTVFRARNGLPGTIFRLIKAGLGNTLDFFKQDVFKLQPKSGARPAIRKYAGTTATLATPFLLEALRRYVDTYSKSFPVARRATVLLTKSLQGVVVFLMKRLQAIAMWLATSISKRLCSSESFRTLSARSIVNSLPAIPVKQFVGAVVQKVHKRRKGTHTKVEADPGVAIDAEWAKMKNSG